MRAIPDPKVNGQAVVRTTCRRFGGRQAWAVLEHCSFILIFTCAGSVASLAGELPKVESLQTLAGKLDSIPGTGPVLKTAHKDFPLTGKTSYLFHTLQDKRLAGREVRLEGRATPEGTFEVERLFTLRGGKVYRVRYYCEVCNIEWLEPGDCVCCQHPTELQEIPVDEPK